MVTGDTTFGAIILLLVMGFLPIAAVTVTAFAKIAVVLALVRNALGIQQLPPNIVIYTLSLILAGFIAMPIMTQAFNAISNEGLSFNTLEEWRRAGELALEPLRSFLIKHSDSQQLAFFQASAEKIWEGESIAATDKDSIAILVPSFLMSELTKAFEIGFLLYLPFLAIDIIVTTILVALGMLMVPPTTIAIPFKLMLFIFLDGWSKLVHGLVLSYV